MTDRFHAEVPYSASEEPSSSPYGRSRSCHGGKIFTSMDGS